MGQGFPHRPFLIVVSAPSGTGKTTVCRGAIDALADLRFSISHTTRPQREGEQDGHDYYFCDRKRFESMRAEGAFLEWANVYGNLYGTSSQEVARAAEEGVDLVVEIDVQGARQMMASVPDAVSVFVLPPSVQELEARLRGRGTDPEEDIRRRLEVARQELAESRHYGYWIVNDDLDAAIAELAAVIRAERTRRERLRVDEHTLATEVERP